MNESRGPMGPDASFGEASSNRDEWPGQQPHGENTGAMFEQMFHVTREQEKRYEQQYLAAMSAGMAAWLVGLKTMQTSMNEWVQNRQETIAKSIQELNAVMLEPGTEDKSAQVAEVLSNQWISLSKDMMAAQVKVAAKVAAFVGQPQMQAVRQQMANSMTAFAEGLRPKD